jgi:hypothetical protein
MSAPRSGPVRNPSHAGSWYTKDSDDLARELDGYLNDVPDGDGGRDDVNVNSTRKKKPRALIAPHAGYSYSGPAAAWAYKTIDPKAVRRIFLLGPSHHVFLTQCALTKCSVYATPIGNLAIDLVRISHSPHVPWSTEFPIPRTMEYGISNPSYRGVRYFQSLVPWSAVFPIPRTVEYSVPFPIPDINIF